jgi:hypothetical protein
MKLPSIPGIPDPPGAIDPKQGLCMAAPRPVLHMKSPDGTAKNQMGKDEGPLTLKRSETIDEEIAAKVVDFLDRNDPKKTNKPFFCYYNPARMHVTTVLSKKYEFLQKGRRKVVERDIGYPFKPVGGLTRRPGATNGESTLRGDEESACAPKAATLVPHKDIRCLFLASGLRSEYSIFLDRL